MGLLIDRHHERTGGVFDAVSVFVEDGIGEDCKVGGNVGSWRHLILYARFRFLCYDGGESCRLGIAERSDRGEGSIEADVAKSAKSLVMATGGEFLRGVVAGFVGCPVVSCSGFLHIYRDVGNNTWSRKYFKSPEKNDSVDIFGSGA